MSRAGASIWVTFALIAAVSGCGREAPRRLDIATTTSVQNSGLLDTLLPAYQREAGVEVRVHAAGSGRSLQMMAEGLAQLVISHAPDTEARALQTHPDWVSRRLAHNRFVIVGPKADPAGARSARDAVDAFRRIVNAAVPFVSRGDLSGTHERENSLWDAAGGRPSSSRYIVSGRGMALALRHTNEAGGYTLADEATYRQLAPELDLEVLYQGDPRLLNVYSVIHPREDAGAGRFAEWLVSGSGRELIAGFTIAGKPAFEVEQRY